MSRVREAMALNSSRRQSRHSPSFQNERLIPLNGILRSMANKLPMLSPQSKKKKHDGHRKGSLTPETVRAIRAAYGPKTCRQLAAEFGMSVRYMENILSGINYQWVK